MSEPAGWTAPGESGPPVPGPDAYPTVVAGPGPQQNWGLAVPGYAVPGYAVLVPRPPRPSSVTVALALTYTGVVLSFLYTLGNTVNTWQRRDQIVAQATRDGPSDATTTSVMSTSITIALVVGLLVWAVPAAGTVVCAVLAGRGRNPARIVLACLTGVFALYDLCGFTGGLFVSTVAADQDQSGGPFTLPGTQIPWWGLVSQLVLAGLAVAVLVLLLVPRTNRYYSPGPGRRFAPQPPSGPGHT